MRCKTSHKVVSLPKENGFTLIEMIIGIVVFSIAMVMIVSVILPRGEKSVDPIYQVRAAKLATTLLNEISSKAFDHNSNLSQGRFRCNENDDDGNVVNVCTDANALGPEIGETAITFNDVDDYHLFQNSESVLDTTTSYSDLYNGYSFIVNVIYDDNYDGVSDPNTNFSAKLITVTVTMPNNETLSFSTYRSNY